MTKIAIRGLIVGSDCDAEWASHYIEKGVITPLSRVTNAIDAARAAGDDIEVEISSPGGSVFAGIDMANAIAEFPKARVTVGSFAASAAALIVLEAARAGHTVAAHRNSILLFHGAWSVTEGGSGTHEDTARLLDQVNEPMKAALAEFGVPSARVERGFSEGRQLTLSASEAKAFGIVSDVIGEDAAAFPPVSPEDAALLLENGVGGLAAFAAGCDLTLEPDDAGDTVPAADYARALADIASLASERDALAAQLADVRAQFAALRDKMAEKVSALENLVNAEKMARASLVGLVNSPDGEVRGASARDTLASLPASKRAAFYAEHRAEIDG